MGNPPVGPPPAASQTWDRPIWGDPACPSLPPQATAACGATAWVADPLHQSTQAGPVPPYGAHPPFPVAKRLNCSLTSPEIFWASPIRSDLNPSISLAAAATASMPSLVCLNQKTVPEPILSR